MNLVPVPKGMCPAFYQFMGAGGQHSDSGDLLMIAPSVCERVPLDERYADDLDELGPCWMDPFGNIVELSEEMHYAKACEYGAKCGCLLKHGWAKLGTMDDRFISERMELTQAQFDAIAAVYESRGVCVKTAMTVYRIK